MRLLILQGTSVFDSYGGIQYYLDDFARMAASLYGRNAVRAIIPIAKDASLPGPLPYATQWIRRPRSRALSVLFNRLPLPQVRAALRASEEMRPDWLVCGHVALAPAGLLWHWLTGRPWAVVAYGVETWGNLLPQDEWCLRRATRVLSISHWTAGILARGIVPEERIRIVPPRIEPALEAEPSGLARRAPFRLLTVSRLDAGEAYKGQDHVIEALARLATRAPRLEWEYSIVGEGTDLIRLQALAAERGLGGRVRFLPPVRDRADLRALYAESDLYVMPSRFGRWNGAWRGEGFGIVYAEAGACGVASLAYRCGGAIDIIEHGVSGVLVEPDDIGALSRALEELVSDPSRAARLGAEARRLVMERFSTVPVSARLHAALS